MAKNKVRRLSNTKFSKVLPLVFALVVGAFGTAAVLGAFAQTPSRVAGICTLPPEIVVGQPYTGVISNLPSDEPLMVTTTFGDGSTDTRAVGDLVNGELDLEYYEFGQQKDNSNLASKIGVTTFTVSPADVEGSSNKASVPIAACGTYVRQ